MTITSTREITITLDDLPPDRDPKTTDYRWLVYTAASQVLKARFMTDTIPAECRVGIALSTEFGERFANLWYDQVIRKEVRLSPRAFEATIHNSAAGFASVKLKLRGPMITTTYGWTDHVAALQLIMGRADMMLVCSCEQFGPARCFLLEKI